ncbi:ammonium transporter [Lysobacter helvus]|uniref:Ammonium transporter n=2 Tax=Lysobacteraceae TaxID=32033 RepID=A0ABN6FWF2_9GAMM|nr:MULTISPECIES: ammonium transporter [Lysobacter]BCT92327.1 ammonium transporter [Lysobacter caseinilyticus]BCT95480.1 ammonium transporter [Lysobacter helvus]
MVDKGDTAWMLVSTVLVMLMIVPGLALFYGGLVRAKNILSVLMQVLVVASLAIVLWVVYGYSLAFEGGSAWIGGFGKLMLYGIGPTSTIATFTPGVRIPELAYVAFQGAFAAISCALVVGAIAERAKFAAVLLFAALWFTFAYLPLAHMVWASDGLLFRMGALDFAGGTVVHINAGVAGLVGAYMLGPRVGFGRERLSPHNLPLTFTGAAMLWVGWFGFNAGSALEANGVAALAFLNTLVAAAAAVLAWSTVEATLRGRASMLGAASGAVSGLVAITPACGTVGIGGALVIGALGGAAGFWGVNALKRYLRADDSLDVFGIHGVCGIVGALSTGVFTAPALGGAGSRDFSIAHQLGVQAVGVVITIAWSGVVALLAFQVARRLRGLRVDHDAEREGLDISAHGESAYEI